MPSMAITFQYGSIIVAMEMHIVVAREITCTNSSSDTDNKRGEITATITKKGN